ncbi:MAG: ATP-binding protein, partial [Acidimicrobiales bacterium]
LSPGLAARPVTAGELAWLIRRSVWRGIGEPPALAPSPTRAGPGVELLAEGMVHNGGRHLRLDQDAAGSSVLAGLAFARFPDALAFPGGEWLATLDALPFPVDASVRFTVVPSREAAKHAARKLAEAADQARHIARTSSAIPLALAEAADRASGLEYALHKERTPLLYAWPRLYVAAPDTDTLNARVVETTEWYRDAGLDVVRPTGDQLALLAESVPGESVRTKAYEQRQAPITLAGAMPTATTELGDGCGPYIGITGGRTVTPVHFDPLAAAQHNRPTAIAITGTSGAGKTTLSRLLGYQLALRGAWVTAVDPKGERGGLDTLVPGACTLTLGPEHAGLLNPFALATSPAEAVLVAVGAAQLILPGRLSFD